MTIFELLFSLTSVILGLGLTQIATNLHSLLLAGRRVRWALEPILLTVIVLMVIVFVWLDQWGERSETSISFVYALLSVLKLLTLYLGAAFVLTPAEPGTEPVDMHAYYDRTRVFTFGALIMSMLLFGLYRYNPESGWSWGEVFGSLVVPFILYAPLMFIRRRWFNVLWLSLVLLLFGFDIAGYRVTA
jgi:hypothetical protein